MRRSIISRRSRKSKQSSCSSSMAHTHMYTHTHRGHFNNGWRKASEHWSEQNGRHRNATNTHPQCGRVANGHHKPGCCCPCPGAQRRIWPASCRCRGACISSAAARTPSSRGLCLHSCTQQQSHCGVCVCVCVCVCMFMCMCMCVCVIHNTPSLPSRGSTPNPPTFRIQKSKRTQQPAPFFLALALDLLCGVIKVCADNLHTHTHTHMQAGRKRARQA